MSDNKYSFNSFVDFLNQNFSIILLVLVVFGLGFLSGSNWSKCTADECLAFEKTAPSEAQPAAEKPSGPSEETLAKVPEVTETDHVQGADNPKITLIEYSDFECPYCSRFQTSMQQIIDEYGDQVAWVYRHFPLQFHENAQKSAEFSECVAKYRGNQAFWEFSDLLFEKMEEYYQAAQGGSPPEGGSPATVENLTAMTRDLGWDTDQLESCVTNGEMTQVVKDQTAGGRAAGVGGTPGTIIVTQDGQYEFMGGALPFEQIKAKIEPMLE